MQVSGNGLCTMSTRYIPELDGLRAIAAIAVVAFHTRLPGLSGGFLGVDVFFVLSGYLTASIALSGKYDLAGFMIRRLRRLWPLLICACLSVSLVAALFGGMTAAEVVPGAFFLGNISVAFFGTHGPLAHTWTLGNEMQFYAIVATLAIFLSRRSFRGVCVALFMTSTISRLTYGYLGEWVLGYYSPFAHSSGLFAGALIATLPIDRYGKPAPLFMLASSSILTAFALARFQSTEALLFWTSVVEFSTAGLIVAVSSGAGAIASILRTPLMRSLGCLSYGVYLWHYPIAVWFRNAFEPLTAFALTISTSLILATLSYHLVERPGRMSLRRPVVAVS